MSGGGFSEYFERPSWQEEEISAYLSSNEGSAANNGYGTGRGYPDVSLAANGYLVVVGADAYLVSGTSASSPVMVITYTYILITNLNIVYNQK